MNWIIENKETLLAIIGTSYALARIIVAMTPTSKDNKIVDMIGKFFGLNKYQGRK